MPGQNTLFSYFTPKNKGKGDDEGGSTPTAFAENRRKQTPPSKGSQPAKKKLKLSSKSSAKKPVGKADTDKENSDKKTPEHTFNALDVVWAQVEGHPWWPAMVCEHPTTKQCSKTVGKKVFVNVQFIEESPTRAWVKHKLVALFNGSKSGDCWVPSGRFFSRDPAVMTAAKKADEAVAMDMDSRRELVAELPETSSEEDSEDEAVDNMSCESGKDDDSKTAVELNGEEEAETAGNSSSHGERKCRSTTRAATKKRKRIVVQDSDESEEDEYKPEDVSSSDDGSSGVDEAVISSEDDNAAPNSPLKKTKRPSKASILSTPKTQKMLMDFAASTPAVSSQDSTLGSSISESPAVHSKTVSKLASFSAPAETSFSVDADTPRPHLKFSFLQPDNIRDINKRRSDEEGYDPKTVYVPSDFKDNCTPGMRQWWNIKEAHFDVVLFFKMGKFYELFHMDADVAVKELGLVYMRGSSTHAGFPEIAYGKYSDILLRKGYKVARIEQTETPDMMADRVNNMQRKKTKFDKVVRREVCQVTTPGTRTYSFLDGQCEEASPNYLLAVTNKGSAAGLHGDQMFGVCFVDTSTAKFWVGQFSDDRHCSRLRTLIAHHPPSQVLYERGKAACLQPLFRTSLSSALKEALLPDTEFWDSSKTLKIISEDDYFQNEETKESEWPAALKGMLSPSDALGLTAADDSVLAVCALGAIVWYLRYCQTDVELLSMKNFEKYIPVDGESSVSTVDETAPSLKNRTMVMDSVTLVNLDILSNQSTGTTEGTLVEATDRCFTPFGKRLFRHWLCSPLCDPVSINDRLDAVTNLMSLTDLVSSVSDSLRSLPDLERLLSKIHTLGNRRRSQSHPDGRAIMFEDGQYSKTKINNFLATLSAFKTIVLVIERFQEREDDISSRLLKKCCAYQKDGGNFPEIRQHLEYFDNAFDAKKAAERGAIIPTKGYVQEYDDAVADIKQTNANLEQNLEEQRKRLKCKIVYVGTAKNRYQMEIPDTKASSVPDSYELTSQRKGFKRYWTPKVRGLLATLMEEEERRDVALRDTMRSIFNKFDQHYNAWSDALAAISVLDVLISLCHSSRTSEGVMCRPEVVNTEPGQKPFIEIRDGRHPCALKTFSGGDFIPNDTLIGVKDNSSGREDTEGHMVLVTGPNMGGKSTLMRQVGLITVLAQMGCYVPAEKCRLSPVDRIFTRLGASDRIMAGESTFFVELSEAAAILRHATPRSLVLLDELGRGTATYDGTAIASAVVRALVDTDAELGVGCRCLFSTHYHTLVGDFTGSPGIQLGHMACMVENETDDPSQETITFLYKFAEGACPKSYGFNAARLANLPEEVIRTGQAKSQEFEALFEAKKVFRSLMKSDGADLQAVLAGL